MKHLLIILLIGVNAAHAQAYKAFRFQIIGGKEKDSVIRTCHDTIYICEKEKLLIIKGAGSPRMGRLDTCLIKAANQHEKARGYRLYGFGMNGTVFIEWFKQGWGDVMGDVKLTIKTDEFATVYLLNKL